MLFTLVVIDLGFARSGRGRLRRRHNCGRRRVLAGKFFDRGLKVAAVKMLDERDDVAADESSNEPSLESAAIAVGSRL
jgi:hypothetical protein